MCAYLFTKQELFKYSWFDIKGIYFKKLIEQKEIKGNEKEIETKETEENSFDKIESRLK